jgi:hypothetical protein
VGRSVDRFWPSKSPENTRKPVGPEWNRDASPPSRFRRCDERRATPVRHRCQRPNPPPRLPFATAADARIRRRDSRSSPLPTPKSAAAAADAVPQQASDGFLRPCQRPTRSSFRRRPGDPWAARAPSTAYRELLSPPLFSGQAEFLCEYALPTSPPPLSLYC